MQSKYLLIVKVRNGLAIRDLPRPEGQGSRVMRNVPVGTQLHAYQIINIDGVDYAWLAPQNPLRTEWVRVAEADHSIEYVEVIKLEEDGNSKLADAINRHADAVENLAEAIWSLAKKK